MTDADIVEKRSEEYMVELTDRQIRCRGTVPRMRKACLEAFRVSEIEVVRHI
ncbi:hypothetical protein JD969_10480 [Planctomycetota bacterium]|nr:hypothetical protein JD969_10480 [Planctomycetota bacterium]